MRKFIAKLMSCGHCGTDAPHGNPSEEKEKCMACECPCEMHKEHTHEEHHEEKPSGACEKCGHAHHEDGHCDCGCA